MTEDLKTPEEMAEEYGFKFYLNEDSGYAMTMNRDAFLAGYQAAKDETNLPTSAQWISVKERLPYCYGEYLLFIKSTRSSWEETQISDDEVVRKRMKYITRSMEISEGHSKGWAFRQTDDVEVTHWMPLPEPPKGEE